MSEISDLSVLSEVFATGLPHPDYAAGFDQRQFSAGRGLGRLDALRIWAAQAQGRTPAAMFTRPRLVVVGHDAGVAEQEVSRLPAGYARQGIEDLERGESAVARLASLARVAIRVAEVPEASANIAEADAQTAEVTLAAIRSGQAIADTEIDSGADVLLLGDLGRGTTTTAAAVITVLTGAEPLKCIGRGSGIDDETWMRKLTVIRDARLRAWPQRHEPAELLRVLGGPGLATITGVVYQAALRRTPVILDGVVSAAAALLIHRVDPTAAKWFLAAQRNGDGGLELALNRMALEPVLDLDLAVGSGVGALTAYQLLQSALTL